MENIISTPEKKILDQVHMVVSADSSNNSVFFNVVLLYLPILISLSWLTMTSGVDIPDIDILI